MPKIVFAESGASVDVPAGERLQAAIERADAGIPFGCREGECATCIIEILEGAEYLPPPNEEEKITLMPEELERGVRLACQLTLDEGEIHIVPAEDNF
jgi:ferredoxin